MCVFFIIDAIYEYSSNDVLFIAWNGKRFFCNVIVGTRIFFLDFSTFSGSYYLENV